MPTISDVARLAGVSAGTVSRVINGMSNVAPEIRERVEKAISDLGYVPNAFARSLRSRKANSISVIVPHITNGHWRDLLRGAEDAAFSHGFVVMVCNTNDNPDKQRRYLEIAASQNVAGVIIAPYSSIGEELSPLLEKDVPTVLVNRMLAGWKGDGVYSDNISGARALTRHLIELGRQRIAMIYGRRELSTTSERIQGYCMALKEAGREIDPRLMKSDVRLPGSGDRFIEEILDEFDQDRVFPDAIFIWNNGLAPRLLQVLNRRGLRVPQDIALACFGDPTDMYFPFLTCIREPAYEIGMNAVQLLFDRLENGSQSPPRELILPTRLIVRYSCGAQLGKPPAPDYYLALPPELPEHSELVKTVSAQEKQRFSDSWAPFLNQPDSYLPFSLIIKKNGAQRLADAFQFLPNDHPPFIELGLPNPRVIEALFDGWEESKLPRNPAELSPEEHVEMAARLEMDAVVCNFAWQPRAGSVRSWADLDRLEAPVSPADQVSRLERYLKAAAQKGIGVGVGVSSPSYAIQAAGFSEMTAAPLHSKIPHRTRLIETMMDILCEQQKQVIRLVCDRFSGHLSFISMVDAPFSSPAAPLADIETGLLNRIEQMLAPAREHHLPVIYSTTFARADWTQSLHKAGVSGMFFTDAACEELNAWLREWQNRLAFVGSIPPQLALHGAQAEVNQAVRTCLNRLAADQGCLFGLSPDVLQEIEPYRYLEICRLVCQSTSESTAV